MSQNVDVVLPELSYTRTDYTAMRAFAQRIPIHFIAERYYSEDSPQVQQGLERFLVRMRDDLIERAIEHNPHFADVLKGARQGGNLTVKALDILVKAADAPKAIPQRQDPISRWLRPKTVTALKSVSLHTVEDLIHWIQNRDLNWWRSIPRIGRLRAKVIVDWINRNALTLGEIRFVGSNSTALLNLVIDPRFSTRLAPIEFISLPPELNGNQGINRASQFCFIQASDDRDALLSYLSRFVDQAHTFRAYRKELERFLLWAVLIRKKALSSLLVDDCEAYKTFLRSPSPAFVGMKVPRKSPRWKPFTSEPMSAKSQKQALIIIRACFKYLVDVRYLAGNPWVVVQDPSVTKEIYPMKIERALTEELWKKTIGFIIDRCRQQEHIQDRIALPALLLMGESGLRRHEVVKATREDLRLHSLEEKIYILAINGKGNKDRLVPISQRTVDALRAHWEDRGLDFEQKLDATPLLSPVVIPSHQSAVNKHQVKDEDGYSEDAIYPILKRLWKNIRQSQEGQNFFTAEELLKLSQSSPHAFRHTFGTLAVEANMPMDVTQAILGHESLSTTAIYTRTREKRMMSEAAKFFAKKSS